MAIKKAYDFNGFSPEYWRIARSEQCYVNGVTSVIFYLYKDAQTRLGSPKKVVRVQRESLTGTFQTRAQIYVAVKAQVEFFNDAEDI